MADIRSIKTLKEINKIITLEYKTTKALGVFRGISGLILTKFYYAKLTKSKEEYIIGESMINYAIDLINEKVQLSSYAEGLLGFCWVIQHLSERNMITLESDSFLAEFDRILFREMQLLINSKYSYDFLYGSIGFAYYYSKRFNIKNHPEIKRTYEKIINIFLDSIEKSVIKDKNGGFKWELLHGKTEGVVSIVDFGLAHGTTSVVNFLTNLNEFPEFKDRTQPLIEKGLFYILDKKIKNKNNLSLFPRSEMNPINISEESSRLAWCYGDLGIGITIWKVGKTLRDPHLLNEALEIFKHSSKRISLNENFIFDAGLCHGAFGVSQLFGRMYKNTGDKIFKNSSVYWKEKGFEMAIHDNDYAGFKVYTKGVRDWYDGIGLLEGISGIGLSLISHLQGFKDDWDECLLIS